jgi:lysophospholipase L1-like esterase
MKKVWCALTMIALMASACDTDGTVWLYHSASGVAFDFEGESVTLTLVQGDLLYQNDPRILPRVAFYVNGERVIDDLIDQAEKTYTLTDSGTVELIKLSEGHMSSVGVKAIQTNGVITPVPQRDLLIEFIGDSITTGYGVDATRDDSFTTATQDVTKSYAYLTAQALNADLRIQAVSGSGVVSGSTGTGVKASEHVMPLYYEWSNPQNKTRPPDIIVINLGTNDTSYTRRDPSREAEFTAAYTSFLISLRGMYPDAYIVCSMGMMGDGLFDAMSAAVQKFDDKNTALLRFEEQRAEDGYGADRHPGVISHQKAAEALIGFLMAHLNLLF